MKIWRVASHLFPNMKNNNYTRRTCRLCGSVDLSIALTLTPSPLADAYIPKSLITVRQPRYPLTLMMCKKCSHVQLHDVIHPKNIYVHYIYETVSSLGLVKHFRDYAQQVVQTIQPHPNALVVDLGSNDGTLLACFKKHGLRVLGVDPAREIARLATLSGIETIPDFFTPTGATTVRKKYGPAAIVTANNIYANIDDLDAFTSGIKELLAPDGVFIFESFYLADLIRHMVFDFIYHEHLSYFSVTPLRTFFQKHNMELIDIVRVPTKGGSLRYTVQRAGGPRTISPSVGKLVAFEKSFGLQNIQTFTSFAKRIHKAKQNLHKFIHTIQKQKKVVAGFGASATTTTLLYHFDLNDTVSFLIDDYEKKQQTFSPGSHIPVLSSRAIDTMKPDYILMLAWRYTEPIVKKHATFLRGGGHFIVPLPKLQII